MTNHNTAMSGFLDLIASEPPAVYQSGAEVLVDATMGLDLVDKAKSEGIAILGIEGFLIDESSRAVYPSRVLPYSLCSVGPRAGGKGI